MKRLFRWKCVYLVATSLEEAWELVVQHAVDEGYVGKGYGDVWDWEREHREEGDEGEVCDGVSPREYLCAVDPYEDVELVYERGLPSGLLTPSEEVYARLSKASVWMRASWWAEVLPAGWSWGWENLEV